MTRPAVPRAVRRLVRDRAGNRCEYCRHPASYAYSSFVCDHVIPRVLGSGNDASELAWACAGCNSSKYAKTRACDPQTGRTVPLFNPRRQNWSQHFAWNGDTLLVIGRTATGRATVEALRLNRPELLGLRRLLHAAGEHPPVDQG